MGILRSKRDLEIYHLSQSGKTAKELADAYHLSTHRIYAILSRTKYRVQHGTAWEQHCPQLGELGPSVLNPLFRSGYKNEEEIIEAAKTGQLFRKKFRNFGRISLNRLVEKLIEKGFITEADVPYSLEDIRYQPASLKIQLQYLVTKYGAANVRECLEEMDIETP